MSTRHTWTARERTIIRALAAEGLSITRTHVTLAELYDIHVTAGQLRGFINWNKIKFFGHKGAPYGNQNKKGKTKNARVDHPDRPKDSGLMFAKKRDSIVWKQK